MLVDIEAPEHVEPAELDRQLARGWFRTGSFLCRTRLLCLADDLYPVTNVRVRLAGAGPGRSLRRLRRRNRERFRIETGPARVDGERERLYQATKHRFLGLIARRLEDLIFGALPGVFDTRELCVFDEDRLVGLSYFDLGGRSMASLLGLYDPDYKRHSLGIYTMLEEMELAEERGARYYYPGYVILGHAGLDYKLRLGETQYFDWHRSWRSIESMPRRSRLVDRLKARRAEMARALGERGVPCQRRIYPLFWMGHVEGVDADYLGAAEHLHCFPETRRRSPLLVEYRPEEDRFQLSRVSVRRDMELLEEMELPGDRLGHYFLYPLVYRQTLCRSASARRIAEVAAEQTPAARAPSRRRSEARSTAS